MDVQLHTTGGAHEVACGLEIEDNVMRYVVDLKAWDHEISGRGLQKGNATLGLALH